MGRQFCRQRRGVDGVLTPDTVTFSVVIEVSDAGDFVPGFLGDRVVEDDVTILRPACFAVFLEFAHLQHIVDGEPSCDSESVPVI